jgi:hypothetical protein
MKDKAEIELDGVDLLLLAIIGLLAIGVLILLAPLVWGWCLTAFNVRKWSRWVWISIGVVTLIVLVLIRARQNQ